MHLERVQSDTHPLYSRAMELYGISFPRHEQREDASQRRILHDGAYQFNLVMEDDAWLGLLLCWETEDFLYVEHFCMLPQRRGQGLGTRALALLEQRGKPVILEIDPPVDELSRRRKAFYERCGYRANPFAHVHPPYHEDCAGHALVIMSCPAALSQAQYDQFNDYLKNTVMDGVTDG